MDDYANWVAACPLIDPESGGYGECDKVTRAMVETFPELRRAAGFVFTTWGRRQHWWCVTAEGAIVDPTEAQFPGGVYSYDEVDLDDPEDRMRIPTGRCADCGDDVYGGDTFCSPDCEQSTRAYLGI